MHYCCWSTNENNEFILWKLGSIQMKILNDIVCQLWIEIQSIELKKKEMQIDAWGIENLLVTMVLRKNSECFFMGLRRHLFSWFQSKTTEGEVKPSSHHSWIHLQIFK